MSLPSPSEGSRAAPAYELRARHYGPEDTEIEVWQVPAAATPQVAAPLRLAGLRGRNLALVEHRVLRRLKQAEISLSGLGRAEPRAFAIDEDMALNLGLLFRTLAPMRSAENMRACADGIEAMGREEAAYWLGMAMHRKNPRRVLFALRTLLTEPRRQR
jgi:hypothetical protein